MDYDDDFSEVPAACQNSKMFPEVGVGLQNLGNTCFANATVQSLIHCPDFHRHLISHKKVVCNFFCQLYIELSVFFSRMHRYILHGMCTKKQRKNCKIVQLQLLQRSCTKI